MKPSHFHAKGLQNLDFNYNLNVKYFSKYRVNNLDYLERKLISIPSFLYAYGSTETNSQNAFRQSYDENNSHYHILVAANERYERELIGKVKGKVLQYERVTLVKLKSNTSPTGFKDQYVQVMCTQIFGSGSEYFLEKIIDVTCSGMYSFKACDWGINTFYFQKDFQ